MYENEVVGCRQERLEWRKAVGEDVSIQFFSGPLPSPRTKMVFNKLVNERKREEVSDSAIQ